MAGEPSAQPPAGPVPGRAAPGPDQGPESPFAELAELAEEPVVDLVLETETAGARPRRPRRWVLPARVAASVVMLAILYNRMPDFDWKSVVPEWGDDTIMWLVGAALLTFVGIVLSTVRWQQVLRAMGLRARLGRLLSLYFAGQFVSNVLPTTIGGDVLRVTRLSRDNGEPADTFASVVLERLTGWLVLPLITFFALAINPGLRELGEPTLVAILVAAGTLIALVAIVVIADHPRLGGRYSTAAGWRRFVGAVHHGVDQLRRQPRAAVGVVLAGLAYQLVLCLAALMVAAALGFGWLGLTPLLAFFPAVLIVQVAPIGISGLGVREGAFVLFLTPLGIPPEQAVALGLVLYALNLVVSLLGAPSFAVGGKSREALA